MEVNLIKINVAVNATGGGQYPAGVVMMAEAVKTSPEIITSNKFWKSEADFVAKERDVILKDIPPSFQISHNSVFVGSGSWNTPQEYLWAGLPMSQERVEGIVGSGNTEIITVTI